MLVSASESLSGRLQGQFPKHCPIACCRFIANTTLVFVERDIENPVQAVLDGPVPASGILQGLVVCFSTGQKVADLCVSLGFCFHGLSRLDPNDGLEPRPMRKGLKSGSFLAGKHPATHVSTVGFVESIASKSGPRPTFESS